MTKYSPDQIIQITDGYENLDQSYNDIIMSYFSHNFTNDRAKEYVNHGFMRRLSSLKRCIEIVFDFLPPDKAETPDRENVTDATIALQSFVINVFGCVDNLAWILVHELKITDDKDNQLPNTYVGLRSANKSVLKALSDEFCDYLIGIEEWFNLQENYRHSLAHRIPLYIPPYFLSEENTKKIR